MYLCIYVSMYLCVYLSMCLSISLSIAMTFNDHFLEALMHVRVNALQASNKPL